MATRADVYHAIDGERDYQDNLWAGDTGSNGFSNPLLIGEFLVLLDNYLRQAQDVWCQEPKPEVGSLAFVRKVAAIAVNCMEQHGAPRREGF